jgi:hypothetical protein
MGAELARAIGIVRARGEIKMTILVTNMRRLVCSPFATPSNIVCKHCLMEPLAHFACKDGGRRPGEPARRPALARVSCADRATPCESAGDFRRPR